MWKIIILIIIGILLLLFCLLFKQIRVFYIGITRHRRIQRNLYKACKKENYLILNDILIQVNEDKFRHADTIIFGDKYIYVVKEAIWLGKIEGFREDEKWRLYYKNTLDHVKNPFLENEKKIRRIANVTNLSLDNFKSIVALAKTVEVGNIKIEGKNEFMCMEDEVIASIKWIEKESKEDKYDPQEVEKYANLLYQHGLNSEKKVKRKK